MKRLFLVLIAAVAITSCTTTEKVISFEEYNKNIEMVKSDLSDKGYGLSGHNRETLSNAVVTGTSFSTKSGYGTEMANDYYTYDTYSFSNEKGDIAEISLKYRTGYADYSKTNYLATVELLGCKTSKASDYDKICGDNSSVKPLLSDVKRDLDVKVYDLEAAILVVVSFVICSPLLILPFM
ncbi:MAG: hypothetical protein U0L54_04945 [Bacteroidales bacterium]|nr:hypothetical protein [Bacteroidales bacterium]